MTVGFGGEEQLDVPMEAVLSKEWNLVSPYMNTPLNGDAKLCLERRKNYLEPGIKKGTLTEEEQCLVISLLSTHGNKWKKIAARVPSRTAKRLEKLVKERPSPSFVMAASNSSYLHTNAQAATVLVFIPMHKQQEFLSSWLLPSWLSNSNNTSPFFF
ncbi:unnamed protein product [Vicia faba]|uniref:Uncharacterized protein n=1 Tax=Vicia faba TaxID=3906 RepID=A0AAV0Z789_VICFA|nr:unnamed protein product [Vicia faba]